MLRAIKSLLLIALIGLVVIEPEDRRRTLSSATASGLHAASRLLHTLAERIAPEPMSSEPPPRTLQPPTSIAPGISGDPPPLAIAPGDQ